MDRLISEEERIRRAEDVLERRKNTDLRISSENFVKEKSNKKLKNMFIQILVCLLIYCGIYYIKNSKNENLTSFLKNVNNILNYDVNFKKIYEDAYKKFENFNINKNNENIDSEKNEQIDNVEQNDNSDNNENIDNFEKSNVNNENNANQSNNNNQNINEENTNNNEENNNISNFIMQNSLSWKLMQSLATENKANNEKNEITEIAVNNEKNITLGIGGSNEEIETKIITNLTEEEQMKIDANYITQNFSIINPLSVGVVTSRFGARASSEIVSANHKGIDLGATTGTIIVSAMDGTVIEASSEGDFGLHLKIANGDITLIYAHCSELLVKEGDKITQGTNIAKVGATGKATGPHLHFEIRRQNRAINPEYLLQF